MPSLFKQHGQQTAYIVIAIVVVVIVIGGAYIVMSGGEEGENKPTTKEPIVVGEIGYKTGAGGVFYQPGHRGLRLYAKMINEAGGVNGREIEIVWRDEAGDVTAHVNELARQEKVDVIIGTAGSHGAHQAAKAAQEAETLFLQSLSRTPLAVYDDEGNLREYVFKTNNSAAAHWGRASARYIADHFPEVETIAYLFQGYAWGHETKAYFEAARKKYLPDTEVVADIETDVFPTSYGTYIDTLEAEDPDLTVTSFWGGVCSGFTTAAIDRGYFEDHLTLTYSGNFLVALGEPELLPHVYGQVETGNGGYNVMVGYEDRESEGVGPLEPMGVQEYCEEYFDFFSSYVSSGSEDGVGALACYVKAYLKADEQTEGTPSTEDIIDALEGIEVKTPLGYHEIRTEDHRAITQTSVGQIAPSDEDWRPYVSENAETYRESVEVPPEVKTMEDIVNWIETGE